MRRDSDRLPVNGSLAVQTGDESLAAERCVEIYRLMVRARVLEERMIKMSKSGEAYFWVGGPGEEAFNVCLGLQVKRGQGPQYDYMHFHYRSSAVMLALGMPMLDAVRQMAMTATDPHSMGRNFVGHFAVKEWNVVPVSSVIEVQYTMAPGTALMQKRCEGNGLTIVTGGDAGTAEGDFTTCMIWSARPGNEVPVLMVVTNNQWGISTPLASQHADHHVVARAESFGIKAETVDGNDPIASWHAIERAMKHCRTRRHPFLVEAMVSRLYGHSSSSGAVRTKDEVDCIAAFEKRLLSKGILDRPATESIVDAAREEAEAAVAQAMKEPRPTVDDVLKHTYAPSPVDAVYPVDYTGLPK